MGKPSKKTFSSVIDYRFLWSSFGYVRNVKPPNDVTLCAIRSDAKMSQCDVFAFMWNISTNIYVHILIHTENIRRQSENACTFVGMGIASLRHYSYIYHDMVVVSNARRTCKINAHTQSAHEFNESLAIFGLCLFVQFTAAQTQSYHDYHNESIELIFCWHNTLVLILWDCVCHYFHQKWAWKSMSYGWFSAAIKTFFFLRFQPELDKVTALSNKIITAESIGIIICWDITFFVCLLYIIIIIWI